MTDLTLPAKPGELLVRDMDVEQLRVHEADRRGPTVLAGGVVDVRPLVDAEVLEASVQPARIVLDDREDLGAADDATDAAPARVGRVPEDPARPWPRTGVGAAVVDKFTTETEQFRAREQRVVDAQKLPRPDRSNRDNPVRYLNVEQLARPQVSFQLGQARDCRLVVKELPAHARAGG